MDGSERDDSFKNKVTMSCQLWPVTPTAEETRGVNELQYMQYMDVHGLYQQISWPKRLSVTANPSQTVSMWKVFQDWSQN